MTHERALLSSILKSRNAYDLLAGRLSEDDLTEQGAIVYDGIRTFYERDHKAELVDTNLLLKAITRKLPNPKHHDVFERLVRGLEEGKVSPENVLADYFAMKREDAGQKLAAALLSQDDEKVTALLEEYERWTEPDDSEDSNEEVVSGLSVAELVNDKLNETGLIKILPRALNDRLDGGLLPGHHVLVFARPEMGKTAMVVNMLSGFVRQGKRVLYVGNEDPIVDIVMRVVCRLTNKSKAEVVANPEAADTDARASGYGLVTFAGLAPGTPREIERLIKQHKPHVVIVDQIRNLGMKEENPVVKLEKAATAMRTLGKRYGLLMVSVTQAGDSATGKAVLDMGDVDFSNTGIPAAVDVMVGLGASRDDEAAERRVISLPKNKRSGIHDYFPVTIDRFRSKLVSL